MLVHIKLLNMTDRNPKLNEEVSEQQQKENNHSIHGRLDNTANPDYQQEENQPDISQVDRQEGTMNNGELGGNFKKETKEDN